MRLRSAMQLTAVTVVAVVAGLFGAQGTLALWNSAVPSNAGTVQAADFRLELNDQVIGGGASADVVVESPTALLTPSQPALVSVAVRMTTTAAKTLAMKAEMGEALIANAPAGLDGYLVVRSEVVASGDCSKATYPSSRSAVVLRHDQPARFCVQVALKPDTPTSFQNVSGRITLPLTITQGS
jgi:hypothetical protein